MSNIVLFFNSAVLFQGQYKVMCFYEGLSKALEEAGNNVLQVVTSDFIVQAWNGSNTPIDNKRENYAINEIKKFKPDLVISFNNSKIRGIEKVLDCPIVLWDADDFLYFNNKSDVIKNLDRYLFFAFFEYSKKNLEKHLYISQNKIVTVKPATYIKNRQEVKKYPISFIGTPFFYKDNFLEFYKSHHNLINTIDFDICSKNLLQAYGLDFSDLEFIDSGDKRFKLVMSLLDLDLHIFGPTSWEYLTPAFFKLAALYHKDIVFSSAHNEKIYNRSLISLSITHSQNSGGYPWRVPDILASDSVLLANATPELINDLRRVKGALFFKDHRDAYDITKCLLQDEMLRKEIVMQQNELVEESFRWKHRFPIMEQLTGVPLFSPTKGKIQRLTYYSALDNFLYKSACSFKKKNPRNHSLKRQSILKNIYSRLVHARRMAHSTYSEDKEYK